MPRIFLIPFRNWQRLPRILYTKSVDNITHTIYKYIPTDLRIFYLQNIYVFVLSLSLSFILRMSRERTSSSIKLPAVICQGFPTKTPRPATVKANKQRRASIIVYRIVFVIYIINGKCQVFSEMHKLMASFTLSTDISLLHSKFLFLGQYNQPLFIPFTLSIVGSFKQPWQTSLFITL